LTDKSGVCSDGSGAIPGKGKNLPVHVVLSIGENLLSIPQLYDRNIATIFHPIFGIMIAHAKSMFVKCAKPLAIGRYEDGTFLIDVVLGDKRPGINATEGAVAGSNRAADRAKELEIPLAITPVVTLSAKAILWYQRLGYIAVPTLVDAIRHNLLVAVNLPASFQVTDFPIANVVESQLAKSTAQSHRNLHSRKHLSRPYEMLHVDYKSMEIRSWGGATGSSTIVDDFSSSIHKIPLSSKHQFVDKFKERVAERANWTILTLAKTLRLAGDFPAESWAELEHLLVSYIP
jgi:hypothetical protein